MQQVTITLTDELERAIERYRSLHAEKCSTEELVVRVLESLLVGKVEFAYRGPFTGPVAVVGSGDPHGSRDHDRILAEIGCIHG